MDPHLELELDVVDLDKLYEVGVKRYSLYWSEIDYLRLLLIRECIKRKDRVRAERHFKRVNWEDDNVAPVAAFYARRYGFNVDMVLSCYSECILDILEEKSPKREYRDLEPLMKYDFIQSFYGNHLHCVFGLPYSVCMQQVYWFGRGDGYRHHKSDSRIAKPIDAAWYYHTTKKDILENLSISKDIKWLVKTFEEKCPTSCCWDGLSGDEIMRLHSLCGIHSVVYLMNITQKATLSWFDESDLKTVGYLVGKYGGMCPKRLIDAHFGPGGLGRKKQEEIMEEYENTYQD